MPKLFIGIDPGVTGGIAFITSGSELQAVQGLPVQAKGGVVGSQINAEKLAEVIRANIAPNLPTEVVCYVEQVASRPEQGRASIFSLGDSYGVCRAIPRALGIRTYTIAPQVWKKAENVTHHKNTSILRVRERFGERLENHNWCEAALIARYGWRVINRL